MTRSKKTNGAKIHCPKHELQKTYDLYENGNIKGIGCEKCFEKLDKVIGHNLY